MILIYSPVPLFDGESETPEASFTAADQVTVLGGVWRVIRVRPWAAFGLYQALAVRIRTRPSPCATKLSPASPRPI